MPELTPENQAVTLKVTSAAIYDALQEVIDPELGLDIVSLGIIYDVQIDDQGNVIITMTLTTPFCPLGPEIESRVHEVTQFLPGIGAVSINLVWEPPWDPYEMASDEAKLELGIY